MTSVMALAACGHDPLLPLDESDPDFCLTYPEQCGDTDPGGDSTALCGNGVADLGEFCDGSDVRDFTCESLTFIGGTVACYGPDTETPCELDLSGCVPDPCVVDPPSCALPPECGNGIVETGEACDLGSAQNLGPPATCNPDCTAAVTCDTGTHWDDASARCSANTRQMPCPATPANAQANTASSITQTWDGATWQPPATLAYSIVASTTQCRFVCNAGYEWNGTGCAKPYVERAGSKCVPRIPGDVSTSDWYWIDSNGDITGLHATCGDVPRGINCSDDDGCCAPNGVAINGDCVVYSGAGGYCYATPQCLQPLTCNIPNHLCE